MDDLIEQHLSRTYALGSAYWRDKDLRRRCHGLRPEDVQQMAAIGLMIEARAWKGDRAEFWDKRRHYIRCRIVDQLRAGQYYTRGSARRTGQPVSIDSLVKIPRSLRGEPTQYREQVDRERREIAAEALARLPARTKLIVMHRLNGIGTLEVAERVGVTPGRVSQACQRMKREVARQLAA